MADPGNGGSVPLVVVVSVVLVVMVVVFIWSICLSKSQDLGDIRHDKTVSSHFA